MLRLANIDLVVNSWNMLCNSAESFDLVQVSPQAEMLSTLIKGFISQPCRIGDLVYQQMPQVLVRLADIMSRGIWDIVGDRLR